MLDMKTPIFNREQVTALINGVHRLGGNNPGFPREWQIHVGPQTFVKLEFEGPVGADEWDALLAHVAFYKQWYKEVPSTSLVNFKEAFEDALNTISDANNKDE